jgi:hypothetical protein
MIEPTAVRRDEPATGTEGDVTIEPTAVRRDEPGDRY